MTHLPRKKFFSENPFSNLVAFIHVYHMLRVICQSINEILTIKEYWNPRAFLDIPWESDFFHICGFHRMLKGHKYFHSTPFSRQNSWIDFPKKSKNPDFGPLLTIFGHIWRKGIFPNKSGSVMHISKWVSNTIQFQEKLTSQFQENCRKVGRADERKDRP